MKNILLLILALALICVLFLSMLTTANTYTQARCTVISARGNFLTIEDKNGNLWNIEKEGYRTGDRVTVKFHTNGTTETRIDDRIIALR